MKLSALLCTFLLHSLILQAQVNELDVSGYSLIPISGQGNQDAKAIDIDNDGDLDIFVVRAFQQDFVLENDGTGSFYVIPDTAVWQISGGSYDAVIIDVNTDGYDDVVISRSPENGGSSVEAIDESGREQLLINNGDGTFVDKGNNFPVDISGLVNTNQFNYGTGIASGDFNGDAIPDFIICNGAVQMLSVPQVIKNAVSSAFWCGGMWRILQNDLYLSNGIVDGDGIPFYDEPLLSTSGITYSDISTDVAVADFDQDGYDDIFICNYFHPVVSPFLLTDDNAHLNKLYLNNTSSPGQFSWDTADFLPENIKYPATSVDVDDVNGDGYPDLVMTQDSRVGAGYEYARTRLFINDGTGTLVDSTNQYLFTTDSLNYVGFEANFADLNSDGRKDIFVFGQRNKVFIKQADNTFVDETDEWIPLHTSNMRPPIFSSLGGTIADFNDDGRPDHFQTNAYEQVRLMFQSTDMSFNDTTTTNLPLNGENTEAAAIADINNDGKMDVVNVNYLEEVPLSIYLHSTEEEGYPYFEETSDLLSASIATANNKGVAVHDFDGDNLPEIIVSGYNSAEIYKNNGSAGFSNVTSSWAPDFSLIGKSNRIFISDFNDDGYQDIFFPCGEEGWTGEQNRIMSWNEGSGQLEDQTSWLPLDVASSIDVDAADINDDGFPDILVANQNQGSFLYLTQSPTTANPNYVLVDTFSMMSATTVRYGDFNNDGLIDFVEGSGEKDIPLKVHLNTGEVDNPDYAEVYSLPNLSPILTGEVWDIEVYDLNNDGYDDFITADFGVSQVFLSNGDGSFDDATSTFFPDTSLLDEAWFTKSLTIADVNEDGVIDIYFARDNQDLLLYGKGDPSGIIEFSLNSPSQKMIIFPNPLVDQSTVRFENLPHEEYSLMVLNVQGEVVHHFQGLKKSEVTIRKGTMPRGQYFLVRTDKDGVTTTKKFIVK